MTGEERQGAATGRRMSYEHARRMSADQLTAAIALRAPLAAVSGPEARAELRMLRTALRLYRAGLPLRSLSSRARR
jgi:hypothetical protein